MKKNSIFFIFYKFWFLSHHNAMNNITFRQIEKLMENLKNFILINKLRSHDFPVCMEKSIKYENRDKWSSVTRISFVFSFNRETTIWIMLSIVSPCVESLREMHRMDLKMHDILHQEIYENESESICNTLVPYGHW